MSALSARRALHIVLVWLSEADESSAADEAAPDEAVDEAAPDEAVDEAAADFNPTDYGDAYALEMALNRSWSPPLPYIPSVWTGPPPEWRHLLSGYLLSDDELLAKME